MKAPDNLTDEQIAVWDQLMTRVLTLNERIWEQNINGDLVRDWLHNFSGKTGAPVEVERLHGLYLLSQFMYFGIREIRVLLRSLYRDLFLMPLAKEVKDRTNSIEEFRSEIKRELDATRFLGVGNPSESGVHLLYYFRQENQLSKEAFVDAARLYETKSANGLRYRVPRFSAVKRYIFLDDLCGSGQTAIDYSKDFLPDLTAADPEIKVHYFSLFATRSGMQRVRDETVFGANSGAVYELDESYKWGDVSSRYIVGLPDAISLDILLEIVDVYGRALHSYYPFGFQDSGLLLGFSHNTPDNTLPLIWMEQMHGSEIPWYPIFKRYPKK